MINRIFLDSSIFIEPLKGNKVDFYKLLISNLENELYINDVVLSEYLYYVLAFNSDVSPKTLQRKNQIEDIIEQKPELVRALNNFILLPSGQSFMKQVPVLMAKYNLLPNDAIILATCKLHGTKLASHDADFIIPCQSENIDLINELNPKF
jgi:predicted nucleic acid-binding protein